jgi:lipopolysaccharide export LptBFGC system permease protein LptF
VIISRYISKEIIVNICWVSLVLFGLVLLSRFNIFLSQAEVGKISAENIFFALILFSPGLLNLVLPISVFLAVGFVLTPIFKNHDTVLTAGSMTHNRLISGQKFVILGVFLVSMLLSGFISPYFTSKGEDLLDKDNSFASRILSPSGLVALQADTFNVYGNKANDVYEDLIFIDSQSIDRFIYGNSAVIEESVSGVNLILSDGFFFDNEMNAISKFQKADIPIADYSSKEYVSTFALFNELNLENIKELFIRVALPIFCVISFIFSIIFSSYSSFFGRERTYFFLSIFNILYLLLTLSAFESSAANFLGLLINFYWMHILVLLIALLLGSKRVKKGFGYVGI